VVEKEADTVSVDTITAGFNRYTTLRFSYSSGQWLVHSSEERPARAPKLIWFQPDLLRIGLQNHSQYTIAAISKLVFEIDLHTSGRKCRHRLAKEWRRDDTYIRNLVRVVQHVKRVQGHR
jgi:hypothetical protein